MPTNSVEPIKKLLLQLQEVERYVTESNNTTLKIDTSKDWTQGPRLHDTKEEAQLELDSPEVFQAQDEILEKIMSILAKG